MWTSCGRSPKGMKERNTHLWSLACWIFNNYHTEQNFTFYVFWRKRVILLLYLNPVKSSDSTVLVPMAGDFWEAHRSSGQPSLVHNEAVWHCKNTEFWRDQSKHVLWRMALPAELWGRIGWRENRPVTTATGDDAAPAANDSTSRTEVSCRWVSGQFCESDSKGMWHCGLIKAISPQKNKVYQLCEQSLLQHSSVIQKPHKRILWFCGGFTRSGPKTDQRVAAWFKGIREYSAITGNASERGHHRQPEIPKGVHPTPGSHPPRLPTGQLHQTWAAEPLLMPTPMPSPQGKPPPRSAAEF